MLAENLLLLALDDEKGTVHADATMGLSFGLAGALIMELALAGRVAIEADKLAGVTGANTGHALLDDTARLVDGKPGKDVRYWVEHLGRKLGDIKQRLLDGLVAQGTLEQREKRILFFFKHEVYPERNQLPEEDVRTRIEAVLFDGEDGSARTRVLIQLALGCGVIDALYRGEQGKQAKARIEALAEQSDPCADAVGEVTREAIEQAQAAAMVAIMAASMAATTAATTAACTAASSAACT